MQKRSFDRASWKHYLKTRRGKKRFGKSLASSMEQEAQRTFRSYVKSRVWYLRRWTRVVYIVSYFVGSDSRLPTNSVPYNRSRRLIQGSCRRAAVVLQICKSMFKEIKLKFQPTVRSDVFFQHDNNIAYIFHFINSLSRPDKWHSNGEKVSSLTVFNYSTIPLFMHMLFFGCE